MTASGSAASLAATAQLREPVAADAVARAYAQCSSSRGVGRLWARVLGSTHPKLRGVPVSLFNRHEQMLVAEALFDPLCLFGGTGSTFARVELFSQA